MDQQLKEHTYLRRVAAAPPLSLLAEDDDGALSTCTPTNHPPPSMISGGSNGAHCPRSVGLSDQPWYVEHGVSAPRDNSTAAAEAAEVAALADCRVPGGPAGRSVDSRGTAEIMVAMTARNRIAERMGVAAGAAAAPCSLLVGLGLGLILLLRPFQRPSMARSAVGGSCGEGGVLGSAEPWKNLLGVAPWLLLRPLVLVLLLLLLLLLMWCCFDDAACRGLNPFA